MALYLHEKVPGISIPKHLQALMEKGGRETGLRIAAEITAGLRDMGAAGAHLMPINDVPAVAEIASLAGFGKR